MTSTLSVIAAGIDEVGRGPLAGPVVAACVHIPDAVRRLPWMDDVTDSKKLTKAKRETLDKLIREHCPYSIAEIGVDVIDRINIFQATMRAMEQAAATLPIQPQQLFIDGNKVPPHLPCPAEAIVKGDSKVKEIACASIIAKVYRDQKMERISLEFPHYHWHKNAGYGTAHHLQAIAEYGVTPHHRQSFAPVRQAAMNLAA